MDYFFEEVQQLRFSIYDVDDIGKDFLGRIECTLGEVSVPLVYCHLYDICIESEVPLKAVGLLLQCFISSIYKRSGGQNVQQL